MKKLLTLLVFFGIVMAVSAQESLVEQLFAHQTELSCAGAQAWYDAVAVPEAELNLALGAAFAATGMEDFEVVLETMQTQRDVIAEIAFPECVTTARLLNLLAIDTSIEGLQTVLATQDPNFFMPFILEAARIGGESRGALFTLGVELRNVSELGPFANNA